MNNRTVIINKVCKLNRETITSTNPPDFINYLDTGNITRNKIDEVKKLIFGKDKFPSRAQRKVQQNTIIYSTVRPEQEHFGIIENPIENLIVSTGFTTIDVVDESINPKYLFYLLTQKNITEYLNTIAANNVTAYPSLNPSDIGNLILEVPDKTTQQKITNVLSSLDTKIEINNKINIELEAMAKMLYDYWFVQFDFPDKNGKPYKSCGGKMIYNEALKREIPVGWEIGCLLDIAKYTNGLACQKHRPTNNEFLKVIKIKEMKEGFSVNTEKVSGDIPEKIKIYNGDILFSWSASLEVIIWSGGAGALNQHIFKVDSEVYPKSFYYFELLNYLQHFKMIAENRKTTMGHITQDHLKQSKIVIPPINIIKNLDFILKPFLDKIISNRIQNQQLTELRDWLLPMLMNGQVTVSDESAFGKDEVLAMVAEPSAVYEKAVKVVTEKVATKKPKKETKPVIKLNNVDVYKRTLLAAEIVFQYKNEFTLGHLKLQKMLYLCKESENMNLPMNFLKQAMGPYDNQLARSLDKQFEEKKWFKYQNGDGLKYVPLENCGKHSEDFKKYFEEQLPTINKLIETFRKFKSQEIEAVATLYACWKEAIANNELVNDAIIINKFYDWSKEKEKFNKPDLVNHLAWMRKNDIYPKN